MFPDVEFLGLDLYTWCILIGVVAAIFFYRLFCDRRGMSSKVFNFSVLTAVVSIIVGYLSAVLFQAWYDWLDTGVWALDGATFYGGLIGAIVCFLLIYLVVGHFLFKGTRAHIHEFNTMLSCIAPCIVVAHAFGRIGCLCAGCCYGAVTDSWVGISMYVNGTWETRIPLQLFESIFLFVLFAVLCYLLLRRKCDYTASIYMIAYGVWRFVIEYWRDDSRGSSGISWLTPSQLTAIIMVAAGIALIFAYKYFLKNYFEKAGQGNGTEGTAKEAAK